MKPLLNLILPKNMANHWSIPEILTVVKILVLFVPLATTAHVSLKIKYKYPLGKNGLLNVDDTPSTVVVNKRIDDLQNIMGHKQEDLKATINRIDELTKKLSSVGTILNAVPSNDTNAKNQQLNTDDYKAVVSKVDEITQKLSSAGTILDAILSNDTIRNVQSCQCPVAKNQQSNTEDYKSAVRKVYNNQIDNFDSVLNFADSVKFDVFKTIYNEMKANGHTDIRKLLQLSESLQKGISDSSSDELVAKAQSLISTLWNENQEAAIEAISDAFVNNSSWPMVKKLTAAINSSCTHCVDNIYTKVIEDVLNKVNVSDILKQAETNLKCLDECTISIHQVILDKLDRNSSSYSDAVVSLALHIKSTMDDPDYKNIPPDMQSRHKEIKNNLPLSVKNAIFSSSLCIKNTKYNEYFFASAWLATSSGLKEVQKNVSDSTSTVRSVFTWIPGGSYGYGNSSQSKDTAQFRWKFSAFDDNKFIIINRGFDEYLYLSTTTFDPNGRIPLAKKLSNGTSIDSLGYWSFEVNEDHVYIKNSHQNEYLFAHSLPAEGNEKRRTVLTFIPGGPTSGSEWEIIDCTTD